MAGEGRCVALQVRSARSSRRLLACCRLLGGVVGCGDSLRKREPYWYLRELFEKLPLARTRADYLALLPTPRPTPSQAIDTWVRHPLTSLRLERSLIFRWKAHCSSPKGTVLHPGGHRCPSCPQPGCRYAPRSRWNPFAAPRVGM